MPNTVFSISDGWNGLRLDTGRPDAQKTVTGVSFIFSRRVFENNRNTVDDINTLPWWQQNWRFAATLSSLTEFHQCFPWLMKLHEDREGLKFNLENLCIVAQSDRKHSREFFKVWQSSERSTTRWSGPRLPIDPIKGPNTANQSKWTLIQSTTCQR